METNFPYHIDKNGRTAKADADRHIRDLIEQTLFTSPGERVNRPAFGTNLLDLVFDTMSDEMFGATKHLVQGALQQNLMDLVQIRDIHLESDTEKAKLSVTVKYTPLNNTEMQQVTFQKNL